VTVRSRYAGAMLLHAFAARAGAGDIFRAAAGQDAAPQDVALLAAVSACFALGAATTEQFKHLAAAEAGPLAGLSRLPGLRTLRPGLAAIADRAGSPTASTPTCATTTNTAPSPARPSSPPLAEVVTRIAEPFVQVIYDIEVSQMAFGRIALLGDAAFAVHPHAAAGTAKAAADG
jgi:2-polyprenyl-6-methoxyphenol hydroxylase-like FAD-dependent oxidoreductase